MPGRDGEIYHSLSEFLWSVFLRWIRWRKSLEEKIQAKQELINALNIRMESEQRELEELFEQKKRKELEAVSDIIEDAGLAP